MFVVVFVLVVIAFALFFNTCVVLWLPLLLSSPVTSSSRCLFSRHQIVFIEFSLVISVFSLLFSFGLTFAFLSLFVSLFCHHRPCRIISRGDPWWQKREKYEKTQWKKWVQKQWKNVSFWIVFSIVFQFWFLLYFHIFVTTDHHGLEYGRTGHHRLSDHHGSLIAHTHKYSDILSFRCVCVCVPFSYVFIFTIHAIHGASRRCYQMRSGRLNCYIYQQFPNR